MVPGSTRRHPLVRGCAVLAALAAAAGPVMGANTWDGGAGDANWSSNANWDLDTAPTLPGLLTFSGTTGLISNNDLTGKTVSGFTFNAGAGSFVIGGNAFTLNAAINNNSGVTQTINNAITWSIAGSTVNNAIGGNGNVVFGGAVTSSVGGGPTFLFNAPLTSFNGGFGMTTGTGARTNTFGGAGNVSITGLSNGAGTSTGNVFNWSNSGTLTLNGTSVSGAVNLNAGTTLFTGDHSSNGSQPLTTFTVGSGATPVTSAASPVGVNTGNATLKIVGNRKLGATGAGNTTLVIKGGNTGGTPIGQGTLSLADGSVNSLTINNATAGATLLTMAGAAGQSSILNMEIGNNSADQILLANGGKISVGAGGVALNVTGLGGFDTGAATQSLTLISAAGGGLTAGGTQFTGSFTTGNFGGYTTATLSNTTTTALILTLGGLNAAPATGYWKGGIDGTWATLTGGLANNSNWTSDAGGTTDAHQVVGATSDVIFSAPGATNTATTLGANFSIKSLTFASDASVGGANTLAVGNSGSGITVASGVTGTINSILGGSAGVTKNGLGTLVLGGSNTYTGGLTINDGTVRAASSGAFNASAPQAVAFGAGAPSTARLQLNGNSATIGALSSNATPGSPVVENASAGAATLTVSQTVNSTYAGLIQDGSGGGALGLVKTGGGALTLGGNNTYTGATAVSGGSLFVNGNHSAATGAVSVASGAVLGGGGTVGGATTIASGGTLTGGGFGSSGTLTFSGGLNLASGSIVYFDSGDFIDVTGGSFTAAAGTLLRFDSTLSTGSYNLIGLNGAVPTLSDFTLQFQNGSAAASTYSLGISDGKLVLSVTSASTPIPSITLTAPAGGSRIMVNTGFAVGGTVSNVGVGTLNGALADNGGNITVSGFSPANPSLAAGESTAYTASANSGSVTGARTLGVSVSDASANPESANAGATVSVLQDRVVSASTVTGFGSVHQGASVAGTTSLTSTGADNANTRVTVGNAAADANGIAVTGGAGVTFDGSTSDTRTVSGNITTLGNVNGSITLTTTGEAGVTGTQNPVNVVVNYSASVYSGKAAWTSGASGNWATGGNWTDTLGGGVAGAPGVDGVLSIGDTATFGNVTGSPASLTVSLNGASPTLAGLTFNSTSTAYTLATGSGGTITLQGAATPVDVSTAFSPVISATLAGSGLNKTGTGTLILSGANTYTGATVISNGAIQLVGGNDRLATATALTLGSGTDSGRLILGDATTARNQNVAGLSSAGTGTANAVVGAAAANSVLTVTNAAANTYAGTLGGAGVNENNLALVKAGGGVLTLTGNNTYVGGTTLGAGSLNVGSANAIGTTGAITFNNGTLQYSAANTTDYSARFLASGNNDYKIDTNGQNVTFANGLAAAGTSGLTKSGTGVLTLAASGNTYAGSTTIAGGVLATPDALTNTLKITGGVWQPLLTSDLSISATLGETGAGKLNQWTAGGFAAKGGKITVELNGGAQMVWNVGNFQGAGAAAMVFGSTTSDHQVELKNSFTLGNDVSNGFNRVIFVEKGVGGDSGHISGAISQGIDTNASGDTLNTGITKQGAGTLIFSGANTYTGTTLVTAGKLLINGNQSGATGTTTVSSGATLGGGGIVGGAVIVNSGAILRPGVTETGTGVLTFNNSVTLAAGSSVVLQINDAGTRGVDYSAVNVYGSVFGQATVGVSSLFLNIGHVLGDGATFDLFNSFDTDFASTFTSVTAAFNSVTLTGLYSGSLVFNGQSGESGAFVGTIGGQTFTLNNFTGDLLVIGNSAVPEPAAFAGIAGGAALLAVCALRRRNRTTPGL